MTKVCHMTSAHGQNDSRIFYKECCSLAKAGYDVYLVVQGMSSEKNGVHIVGTGPMPAGRLRRMTQMARRVYKAALAVDADIYHFHDPELLPYGLKLKRRGKKVIFDSHEKYVLQFRVKPYLPKAVAVCLSYVYSWYEKYVLRRIDGIVFPCALKGEDPFAGQCRHTALVDNYPLLSEFYDKYEPCVHKHDRSICYMGGLTYSRGITHLIKAADAAGCTAFLAGPYDSLSYREQVEAMPEYSCVKYLGVLGRDQVFQALQQCQIGMANILNTGQYNIFDNMATKVYEYMSLGLPVILSRSPYNVEMTEQYHFGICVDPENVEEIAQAIRYLLNDPDEARQMGENGRQAVKEHFNWGVEEKKLLALYKQVEEQ